jgi:hypothetical protein
MEIIPNNQRIMKRKLLLYLALVLIGGSIYCLTLLFGPPKLPPPIHELINLSNGGIIYIDYTNVPPKGLDGSDVDFTISYKRPSGSKIEPITVGECFAPFDESEVSAYVASPLVVLIIHGSPYVRTKDGTWKIFTMGNGFPSTNDFSAEDIQLMGITSRQSFPLKEQGSAFTTIESFDPQTRILLMNYSFDNMTKHLKLQLSEDGTKLKVLDVHDEKFPTP